MIITIKLLYQKMNRKFLNLKSKNTFCFIAFIIIFQILINSHLIAQENQIDKITVRKESALLKAIYDYDELKVLAQDKYGNIRHDAIRSFEMHYETKWHKSKKYKSGDSNLTYDMRLYLGSLDEAKKIFFTNIIAEDEFGNFIKLPDLIEMFFPKCKKVME
jgi:hypothetical protein